MKHFLCCLALLCFFFNATAQQPTPNSPTTNTQQPNTKALSIGDTVPDLLFNGVSNTPDGQARISDYKGQLLILDFWATWCAPCITMLPKSDSLNKVYKGKAVILPVTYQTKEEVAKLLRNKSSLRNITMPMVTSDNVLRNVFPHQELPHYVWIDANSKVKAITGYKEVTATNINTMLNASVAEEKALPVKNDVNIPYNRDLPLLFNNLNITPEDLQYSTVLTGYKPGLRSHFDFIRSTDKWRFTGTNMSLFNLLLISQNYNNIPLPASRVINESRNAAEMQGKNWSKSTTDQQKAWMQKYTYCYELIIPQTLSNEFYAIMRQDFARVFPQYKTSMQTRPVECLVLIRTSSVDKIRTSGARPSSNVDHTEFTMINGPISTVLYRLATSSLQNLKEPLVDNTGYRDNIDISLIGDLTTIDSIREALRKYDLDIVRKTMNIEMLVISDTK